MPTIKDVTRFFPPFGYRQYGTGNTTEVMGNAYDVKELLEGLLKHYTVFFSIPSRGLVQLQIVDKLTSKADIADLMAQKNIACIQVELTSFKPVSKQIVQASLVSIFPIDGYTSPATLRTHTVLTANLISKIVKAVS